jgi:hypothetical protein
MFNLLTFIRIAAAPLFPGLRRFPEGRGFKQWTGDDSKALMKVRVHILIYLSVRELNVLRTRSIYPP